MNIPILGPIFRVIGDIGGKWIDKQRVIAEGSIAIARARAEATAQVQITRATAEIEWERTMAQASETSWKDELWTVFFVTILTAAFIPGMEPYITQGFTVIGTLPDWFGYAVMLAISAAFGKNIVKDFTSLETNSQAKQAVVSNVAKRTIDKRE